MKRTKKSKGFVEDKLIEIGGLTMGDVSNTDRQHIGLLIKDIIEYEVNQDRQKVFNDLFKLIEKGKIGELDYYWNGKKRVKDNIIFTREELVNFFRYRIYGKPNTPLKDFTHKEKKQ